MFSLTVAFGQGMWTLMFKAQETAAVANDTIVAAWDDKTSFVLTDDFGQQVRIRGDVINGVILEDMEQTKLAHIERALHQQRTQIKAQEMANSDQVIRSARMRQGPAVIDPTGNGMFRS